MQCSAVQCSLNVKKAELQCSGLHCSVFSVAVADIGDIGLPLVEAADLHSSEPPTLRMMTPAADSLILNVSACKKYQMTTRTQL